MIQPYEVITLAAIVVYVFVAGYIYAVICRMTNEKQLEDSALTRISCVVLWPLWLPVLAIADKIESKFKKPDVTIADIIADIEKNPEYKAAFERGREQLKKARCKHPEYLFENSQWRCVDCGALASFSFAKSDEDIGEKTPPDFSKREAEDAFKKGFVPDVQTCFKCGSQGKVNFYFDKCVKCMTTWTGYFAPLKDEEKNSETTFEEFPR